MGRKANLQKQVLLIGDKQFVISYLLMYSLDLDLITPCMQIHPVNTRKVPLSIERKFLLKGGQYLPKACSSLFKWIFTKGDPPT